MHLHLTLPESLVEHPAFSASPFAADHLAAGADSEAEEGASTSQAAEDDEEGSSTAATIFNVGILLLIPLGMYFLLIRPNKKRRQAAQELQSSIAVGDEILLTSGVYGFITAMDEGSDVVWVEIDDDVQVRVTRAAISGKAALEIFPSPNRTCRGTYTIIENTLTIAAAWNGVSPERPTKTM